MKGTKFQIGDEVRVRDCAIARRLGMVGKTGVVVYYRFRLYELLFEDEYCLGLYLAGELEFENSAKKEGRE